MSVHLFLILLYSLSHHNSQRVRISKNGFFHVSSHSFNLLFIQPVISISFQLTLVQRRQRLNSCSATACIATTTTCKLGRLIIDAKMARWSLGSLRKGEVMRFSWQNWIFVDEKKCFSKHCYRRFIESFLELHFHLPLYWISKQYFLQIERTRNALTILQRLFGVHSWLCIWNRKARSSRDGNKNVV